MATDKRLNLVSDTPLEWPEGLKRTKEPRRGTFKCTFFAAFEHVRDQLRRLGVEKARFSATMRLRNDGLPYAEQPTTGDAGVAVYFTRGETEFVLPVDRYKTLMENTRAAAHVLEAYRTVERHGGRRLAQQAMEGFRALTPGRVLALPEASWWRVLGFLEMPDSLAVVSKAYRDLLRSGGHPDQGSPPDEFRYAARAMAQAREHFGKQAGR